jgi:iron complex transport system substrate-binding protein
VAPPTSGAGGLDWPLRLRDGLGNTIELTGPAKRVVSLSPNLTEIVCFVGGYDQLVGVTDFDKYPPEIASKPRMGGIVNPSLEKVVAAKPDVVLVARGLDRGLIDRLRSQGVQVFGSDPQNLDDVRALTEQVAQILGRASTARSRLDALRAQIAQTERAVVRPDVKPKALAVIEVDPLFVAGSGSFVDDLLRLAGYSNAAEGSKPWAQWSAERVLAANPDLVFFVSEHGEISRGMDPDLAARLKTRSPWRNLKAVQQGCLFSVTDDYVTIPGPRLVKGLAELVEVRKRYFQANRQADAHAPD